MTDEQQKVFDAAMAGQSFFLTGNAGTGKSFVLKQIIQAFKEQECQVYVTASTGIAAVNVHGSTLHSLLRITPAMDLTKDLDYRHKKIACDIFTSKSSILIIDEISMCGVDLFAYLMKMIEYAEERNHFRMQMILVGDFSQLPPVYDHKETEIMREIYGGVFSFQSSEWTESRFKTFVLTKIIRQDNPAFMQALNQIRIGDPQGIKYVNQYSAKRPQKNAIMLTGTNASADKINRHRLNDLPGVSFEFIGHASDKFSKSARPTEDKLTLKVGARVMVMANTFDAYNGEMGTIEKIVIDGTVFGKYGPQVDQRDLMSDSSYQKFYRHAVKKIKATGGLKQAKRKVAQLRLLSALAAIALQRQEQVGMDDLVKVDHYSNVEILVKSDEDHQLKLFGWHEWKMYKYAKKGSVIKKHAVGTFKQIPLRLGYAITVHKSQGQTFRACNFMPQIFADGQLYVALSRVTDVSRLYLTKPLSMQMVRAAPEVVQFYRKLLSKEGIKSLGIQDLDLSTHQVTSSQQVFKPVEQNTLVVKPGRAQMLKWLNNLDDQQYAIARDILRNALKLGGR